MSTANPPNSAANVEYALLGSDHAKRGRALFRTGLALMVAAMAYLTYSAKVVDVLHLYQGLIIFALSFVPGLLWARSGGSRFPVFEPIMLLCASAYAIPLLNGREQLATYAPDVITKAGWAVMLYQLSAVGTYNLTRGRPGRSRFWTEEVLGRNVEKWTVYGLILSALYIIVMTFTPWIPADLESVLRAVFFGIGVLCTFISTQRWGRGELTRSEKTIVVCALVPQLLLQTVGLLLIGTITQLGIALLGFLSGGKRIPWATMLAAFAILAVLHNGKSQMRAKYWEQEAPPPTFTQLPGFYQEWIRHGLEPPVDNSSGESDVSVGHKLLERTSLMHILCLVVNYSPDRQPYLNGATYGYVLPQLVPRLFYPGKPPAHIATYKLAIYYGLQDEDSTATTTIAFGMLAEAYANFGLIGGILLGIFWGVGLKKMQVLSVHSPMFSLAGLLMILLTAWSFDAELTMAVWASSLSQAIIVVLGVPAVLRGLLGT